MQSNAQESFVYNDKSLDDLELVTVATRTDVFYPTSTTVLLLRAVRTSVESTTASVLDLGCGCGIVGIVLAKRLNCVPLLFASDICERAVKLTKKNALFHDLKIDCRQGNTFEPWSGMKFDLIVEDVSAISEPIAELSSWYKPPIVNHAGSDGTRWVVRILSEAREYLCDGGQMFFPVLSLSNEIKILDEAQRRFRIVTLHQEQWYPLSGDLLVAQDYLLELADKGIIRLEKRGSRWCWSSRIYSAAVPVVHNHC